MILYLSCSLCFSITVIFCCLLFSVLCVIPSKAQQLHFKDNNILQEGLQEQHQQQQRQQQQQQQQQHPPFFGNSYFVFPDEWNTIKWDRNRVWPTKRRSLTITTTTTTTAIKRTLRQQQQRRQQQQQSQWSTTNIPINLNSNNNRNENLATSSNRTKTNNVRPNNSTKPFIVYVNNQPIIPTLIPFWSSTTTPTPQHLNCLQQCPTTMEFNPVCANNRQTYHNEQKFHCAKYCGANIEIVYRGNCE